MERLNACPFTLRTRRLGPGVVSANLADANYVDHSLPSYNIARLERGRDIAERRERFGEAGTLTKSFQKYIVH